MSSNKRVVKFRRRRSVNIGIIIFTILFLYIAINVYLYFTKEHMSIYEVKEGSNVEDNKFTGLILREEEVITTDKAGYVFYFQKDGERVAKNTSVYAVDESRQIMDTILNSEEPFRISEKVNAQFLYKLEKFRMNYSDSNFQPVYSFKEEARSTVLDLLNQAMIEEGGTIEEETGLTFSYGVVRSPESGIVTYYLDNYEHITAEMVSREMFDTDSYSRTLLRTNEMVSKDTPVYKLISSDVWNIILPLSKEQYAKLSDKSTISLTIEKDDQEAVASVSLYQKGSDYYAKLTLDKFMSNYVQDRFLDLRLHLASEKGYKIPLSSIVEKDFYLVPLEFFTIGADSGKEGLVKETYSENGEVNYTFIAADKYYDDGTYGYVDTRLFPPGTWIKIMDSEQRYQLSQTAKLTGVFNVNMGYAVFKRIEPLYQNDSYCIVKKNTSYGLSLYDHIALDGSTAVEQKIIY